MNATLHALLLFGIITNLTVGIPQLLRTVVKGRTDGLSPLGLWTSVVASSLWLCFALATDDRLLLASNVLTLSINISVLVAFRRYSGVAIPRRLDAVAGALICLWAAAFAVDAPAFLAMCGSFLSVVLGLPQLLRIAAAPAVGGVARGTYVMAVIGNVVWASYWGLKGEPIVAGSNVWGAAVAMAGLTLLSARPLVATSVRRVPGALRLREMLPVPA